jgi:hypothetical protein
MARPRLEVADIFREHGAAYVASHRTALSPEQRKVMRALTACRTAELGGHLDACGDCGHQRISYNSCRNRHCPKCQSLESARWLEERRAELLPVRYFHLVFTLPAELAPLGLQNKRVIYNLLFSSASATLRRIAADPKHLGAEIGFLAVLHTWGQQLQHHPHLHCVVPGGGLSPDGKRWINCRRGFFLPVRVLSRLFRRLFLEYLEQAFDRGRLRFHGRVEQLAEPAAFARLICGLRRKEWVVYAKPPFGSPEKVLGYLGRYSHRVALSHDRLVRIEDGEVSFRWKDYRHENRQRVMTLPAQEFIRRFLLHVLPEGFQRIRHYGWLSNRKVKEKLAQCRRLLGCEPPPAATPTDYRRQYEEVTGLSLARCPACNSSNWHRVEVLAPSLCASTGHSARDDAARLDSS